MNDKYNEFNSFPGIKPPSVPIADICCGAFIILEFLPITSAVSSTITNAVRLFFAILFVYAVANSRGTHKTYVYMILFFSFVFAVVYFWRLWYQYTSLLRFLNKNLLCCLYACFGLYYKEYINEKFRIHFTKLILSVLSLTSITTIIALLRYPEASRNLGLLKDEGIIGIVGIEAEKLYLMNVAGWGQIYGMALALIPLMVLYKELRNKKILLTCILITVCVFMAQITFAILFVVFAWIIFWLKPMKVSILMLLSIVAAGLAYVFAPGIAYMIKILAEWANLFNLEVLNRRMYQLYVSFSNREWYGDSAVRFRVYGESIRTFWENPFIGYRIKDEAAFEKIGLHSQIFDTLGATGVIGFSLFLYSFVTLVKLTRRPIKKRQVRLYYDNCLMLFVFLMLNNGVWGFQIIFFCVFSLWGCFGLTESMPVSWKRGRKING